MDSHHCSCIKLFTFSLPLFCLLSWSWAFAATTTTPPSSALLAVDTLQARGYSVFASLMGSLSDTNFSGTLLIPPDFAFSFATAMFFNNRRPPPRPSVSLLLYHTIKPSPALTWKALSSLHDGDEVGTLYNNNCLYLFKGPYNGEISVSPSPIKNPRAAVKIRQPDLYVDYNLTVHGIDGVLDPSFASKCSVPASNPTARNVPRRNLNRNFLDHAVRALRRRGYNVVAAAMAIGKSELLSLKSVTVFAVSDANLFRRRGGFRYDFRHHVLPVRHRFADLANSAPIGMRLESLAPNKTVLVNSVDGEVTVNGVPATATEVYRNRWIVVISVVTSLDDADTSSAPSPAPFSGFSEGDNIPRVPSPAPAFNENTISSPSPADSGNTISSPPAYIGNTISSPSPSPSPAYFESTIGSPSPSPSPAYFESTIGSPLPSPWANAGHPATSPVASPAEDDVAAADCELGFFVGAEEADLFCPLSKVRRLLPETEISGDVHVDESKPLDGHSVNVADDIFFYI